MPSSFNFFVLGSIYSTIGGDDVVDADLIGVKVRKKFSAGWFDGEVFGVIGNDIYPDIYRVRYTDGDTEEFNLDILQKHIILYWKYHDP